MQDQLTGCSNASNQTTHLNINLNGNYGEEHHQHFQQPKKNRTFFYDTLINNNKFQDEPLNLLHNENKTNRPNLNSVFLNENFEKSSNKVGF